MSKQADYFEFPSLTGVINFLMVNYNMSNQADYFEFPSLTGVIRFLIYRFERCQ